MNLQEFTDVYTDVGIDYDGVHGNQCMDLFHYYELDVLGISEDSLLRAGTAYEAFKKSKDHFDKFIYRAGNVPEPGDIIFWNTGIGKYGHVAIFKSGDSKSFTSFDQNFPVGSKCHLQNHNYKSIAGWLRYNKLTKDEMKKLDDFIAQTDARLDKIENLEGETEIVRIVNKLKPRNWGINRIAKIKQVLKRKKK